MNEFSREEVVKLALDAGFSRHEVMNGITKFERLMGALTLAFLQQGLKLDQ